MRPSRRVLLPLLALLALPLAARAEQRWLHVHVDEGGQDGERVRINIPIELAEAVMPMIEAEGFHKGVVQIEGLDGADVDLQKLIAALKEARDGEYVRVESADENVRIRKEEGRILIDVDEAGEDAEKVHISLRMDVLEALATENPKELDALAALRLMGEDDGMLITVDSADETVRIWIDNESGEKGEDE